MKKIFTFLASALVASLIAHADVALPPQVKVSRPTEITSQFNKKDAEKLQKNKSPKFKDTSYWSAFSDRSDNTTYNGPSASSGAYKKLDLGEPVFIADVQNGFALVFTQASNEFTKFPDINPSVAKSLGWIPLDNLVLWDVCPMDERGVYQKALIISNLDEYGDNAETANEAQSKQNRVFSRPDNKGEASPVRTGQVFYVIKENNDKALLANSYKLAQKGQFAGWVQKSAFTSWNQRSCIEQKWNQNDLQLLNGTTVDIKDGKGTKMFSFTYTPNRKRTKGEVFRYPVLNNDKDDKNSYKATFFSTGGELREGLSTSESNISDEFKSKVRKMRTINLIVVIDGTSSMKQNFPAIKSALQSCMKNFDERYNIRIGAVIYRDPTDGEYVTEALSVQDSKNYDKVWQFFNTGGRYGIKSSDNDHSAEEDMFAGYEVALDNKVMGYDPEESNIFIVVGDCGNPAEDEQSPRVNKIINGLVKNNVQLIVFQTRNYGLGASQGYRMQNNKFMKENIEKQYTRIGVKPGIIEKRPDGTGREYHDSDSENGVVLIQCMSRFPNGEGTLSPNELANMVQESILKCYDAVQTQENFIVTIENGSNPNITVKGVDVYDYLKGKYGKKFADDYLVNQRTIAQTGYTQIKNKDGRNLWEPVIYISNTELANLLKRLKPAYQQAREGGNDRLKYVEALEGIVKAMIPDAQTGETDISSITEMIAGLNVATKSTSSDSYKIKDLLDPNVVDDSKYRKLLSDYKTKYQRLEEIQKHYDYKKTDVVDDNVTYYWIPVADLP